MPRQSPARISIALATYNGGAHLSDQLQSLVEQEMHPYEVVVGDDCSTDSTWGLLEKFAAEAPYPVHLTRNPVRLNFTGNFLATAQRCSGDWVAFCDQDDVWSTTKIAKLSDVVAGSDPGVTLFIHEGTVVDVSNHDLGRKMPSRERQPTMDDKPPYSQAVLGFSMMAQRSMFDNIMATWDWSIYHQFVMKHGAPLGHDVLVYAWATGHVEFIPEALVRYRFHDGNATAPALKRRSLSAALTVRPENSHYRGRADKWAAEVQFLSQMFTDPPDPIQELSQHLEAMSLLWSARACVHATSISRRDRWSALRRLRYLNRHDPRVRPFPREAMARDVLLTVSRSLRA